MSVYDWPRALSPRTAISFDMRGSVISGPPSILGNSQVASYDAGYWTASLKGVAIRNAAEVKLFRAMRALMEGGAHQVRLPVFDCSQAPWQRSPGGKAITDKVTATYDDGAHFDDGSLFAQSSIPAFVAAAAAIRATSIVIDIASADDVMGGEYFSIRDRLYVIKRILSRSGTVLNVGIWPPLRAAAAAGVEAIFDKPSCRMRLATESDADLAIEARRTAFPDLNFIEVF